MFLFVCVLDLHPHQCCFSARNENRDFVFAKVLKLVLAFLVLSLDNLLKFLGLDHEDLHEGGNLQLEICEKQIKILISNLKKIMKNNLFVFF